MKFKRFLLPILLWCLIQLSGAAAPVPLETPRNTKVFLPASILTTNGVAGLTNLAPNLMVSGVSPVSAQGGTVSLVNTQAWVRRFNDSVFYGVYNLAMTVDHSGNVITTGSCRGLVTGDDLVTIKYSPDGTLLWTNRYSSSGNQNDFGRVIGSDANDNVYVAGNSPGFAPSNDVVLVKYSSSGSAVWTNRYSQFSPNSSQVELLVVDPAGNSYLSVETFGDALHSVILKYDTSGTVAWTNVYQGLYPPEAMAIDKSSNLFVAIDSTGIGDASGGMDTIKYSPGGAPLWTNRFDRDFVDQAAAMTVDSAGNVLVTGDSFGEEPRVYVTIKYGGDGTPLWTNMMDAPGYQGGNVPRVITDLHDNVFIMGGSSQASADFTNADFTTLKVTSAGVPLWTNRFQELNINNPEPGGIAVDATGNFYLTCHSTGPGASNIDFVTIKYAADGASVWTNRYDGTGNRSDEPGAPKIDNAGNLYVTGISTGTSGVFDFATVKYSDYVLYTPPTNFTGVDSFTFTAVDPLGNSTVATVNVAVLPPNLQFNTGPTNLQFTAQGLRLQVDGARGASPVILFGSTNLMDWQPLFTNLPALGSAQFLDPGATNSLRRFYRARQQQ